MQFGLKTFFAVAIFFSILFVSPAFVGRLLKNIPPFFLPLLLLFCLLWRAPQKFSFSHKEVFGLALLIWSGFAFFSSGGADRIARERCIQKTLLQLASDSVSENKDAWNQHFIAGSNGFYSMGPNQQDNQGYYDDIGPALSWIDAFQKSLRTLWIFHRSLFLFFSFGMIYGTLLGGFFLFRKLPPPSPPLSDALKPQSNS